MAARVVAFPFEGLPHLEGQLIVDPADASGKLVNLVAEMDSRYTRFRSARVQHLAGYNEKAKEAERLPVIWVIHDEFAEWMMVDAYKEAVTNIVARLGAEGLRSAVTTLATWAW